MQTISKRIDLSTFGKVTKSKGCLPAFLRRSTEPRSAQEVSVSADLTCKVAYSTWYLRSTAVA